MENRMLFFSTSSMCLLDESNSQTWRVQKSVVFAEKWNREIRKIQIAEVNVDVDTELLVTRGETLGQSKE